MEQLNKNLILFYERFTSWETEVVRDSGLTLPQMHTIEVIGMLGNPRMKDLAEKLGVVMGTLTVMIKRLEQMGLVLREKNPKDMRSYQITLTSEGKRHYENHHHHHLMLVEEISQSLTPEEQDLFNVLLNKINHHL